MSKLNLALHRVRENSFGVLTDSKNWLVASAFSPNEGIMDKYLTNYARKLDAQEPSRGKGGLAEQMARLFYDQKTSQPVDFNTEHITFYQKKVTEILRHIPKHKVTTYGLIAKKIGSGPRAVGNAVASNPWPLFVACHRVVSSTLTVGNYSMCGTLGHQGSFTKRQLLEREKVPFNGDEIKPSAVWNPSGE